MEGEAPGIAPQEGLGIPAVEAWRVHLVGEVVARCVGVRAVLVVPVQGVDLEAAVGGVSAARVVVSRSVDHQGAEVRLVDPGAWRHHQPGSSTREAAARHRDATTPAGNAVGAGSRVVDPPGFLLVDPGVSSLAPLPARDHLNAAAVAPALLWYDCAALALVLGVVVPMEVRCSVVVHPSLLGVRPGRVDWVAEVLRGSGDLEAVVVVPREQARPYCAGAGDHRSQSVAVE